MATITNLYDVTKVLYEHLEQPMPKDDREAYIEKINKLLELREVLMGQYTEKPLTSDEQSMATSIVEWNKAIQSRLSLYMNIIKKDMNKLKKQKETGMKYENPYETQTDGYFIDKKN